MDLAADATMNHLHIDSEKAVMAFSNGLRESLEAMSNTRSCRKQIDGESKRSTATCSHSTLFAFTYRPGHLHAESNVLTQLATASPTAPCPAFCDEPPWA